MSSAPPDVAAFVANAFILLAFIGTIIAGVVKGVKEWRVLRAPSREKPGGIAAATIMESITLSDWSASNRDVRHAIERMCEAIHDNTDELRALRRALEDKPAG